MYRTAGYTLAVAAMLFANSALPQDDRRTASAERAAETMIAEERSAQAAEKEFIQVLAAAVQDESRDESWARRQESMIRKAAGDADAALERSVKRVDCRRTRCAIDIELKASASGDEHARQLSGIDEWIAGSQPCAYTVVHDPARSAKSVQVFTNCGEQQQQSR